MAESKRNHYSWIEDKLRNNEKSSKPISPSSEVA